MVNNGLPGRQILPAALRSQPDVGGDGAGV